MPSMLETIRNERIAKLNALRRNSINPYPSKVKRTHTNAAIKSDFAKLENSEVSVCGRIISLRDMGKLAFIKIRDFSGELQIFIKVEELTSMNPSCNLKLFDIGDFVECTGSVIKTKTGEISVEAKTLRIICKSLRPLPEKWKGVTDADTRLRKRYLDMIMNPEVVELFVKKAIFWKSIRDFMIKEGFYEVRTPVLEHTTGGADARPFKTHYNALDNEFFLRISLELPLKKAIGGGFEKVFEIGPVFRNEGMDEDHLQDYDMMEFYWAYADYRDNMELTRRLMIDVARKVNGSTKVTHNGVEIELDQEWKELDFSTVMKEHFNIDVLKSTLDEIKTIAHKNGVTVEKADDKGRIIDKLWKIIRKEINGPAFLINEPKFMSPLAKSKEEAPEITERYHVILFGTEMANGYSELNDPIDQYERFIDQQKLREKGDEEAQMLDIDFVEMLEYGMPPVTGMGISERYFSYLVDKPMRQTMLFPQLRHEIDMLTKKIYKGNIKYIQSA